MSFFKRKQETISGTPEVHQETVSQLEPITPIQPSGEFNREALAIPTAVLGLSRSESKTQDQLFKMIQDLNRRFNALEQKVAQLSNTQYKPATTNTQSASHYVDLRRELDQQQRSMAELITKFNDLAVNRVRTDANKNPYNRPYR